MRTTNVADVLLQIASPEGLKNFCSKYPLTRVVSRLRHKITSCRLSNVDRELSYAQITGWIDQGLNEKAYIIPGLGDFGERRYVGHLHPLQSNSR